MMKEEKVEMMVGNISALYSLKNNAGMLQTGWNFELVLQDIGVWDAIAPEA